MWILECDGDILKGLSHEAYHRLHLLKLSRKAGMASSGQEILIWQNKARRRQIRYAALDAL